MGELKNPIQDCTKALQVILGIAAFACTKNLWDILGGILTVEFLDKDYRSPGTSSDESNRSSCMCTIYGSCIEHSGV